MRQFSYFQRIQEKSDSKISEFEIFDEISEGRHKATVQLIRKLLLRGNVKEVGELKRQLPAFTPSGIFRDGHSKENLETYVPCVVLDLDNIEADKLAQVKAQVSECKFTLMCFISPSGNGLKILVKTNALQEEHEACFQQVAKYYESLFNVSVDRSGKDFSRLCFMSYDPEVYYNPDSTTWLYSAEQSQTFTEVEVKDWKEVYQRMISFTGNISDFEPGSRNNFIHLLANNLNRAGVPKENALEFILRDYTQHDFSREEIEATVESAYRNTSEFGTFGTFGTLPFSEYYFPDSIFEKLPDPLKDITAQFQDKHERDIALLSSIAFISGIFPTVRGIYSRRINFANIYLMVIGPATSGKGVINYAKYLVEPIHSALLNRSKMERGVHKEQNKGIKNTPSAPPLRLLILPADITSSDLIDKLAANQGSGILFSTEADTMSSAWKREWSNYSPTLRAAFHHESIAYSRKTDQYYVEVLLPKLSVVLSGTPEQIPRFFPSAEDGLFSRYLFYNFDKQGGWRNVFDEEAPLEEIFKKHAQDILLMHESCIKENFIFSLTKNQEAAFNGLNSILFENTNKNYGSGARSIVIRLANIGFRIAMVLTCLRYLYKGNTGSSKLICTDADFEIVTTLLPLLLEHSLSVYDSLPGESRGGGGGVQWEEISKKIPCDDALKRSQINHYLGNLPQRTLSKYIQGLVSHKLITRLKQGLFRKENCE